MILSDKIENFEKTNCVNTIRFSLYDDQFVNENELKIIFEDILREKILKIYGENEFGWEGRKYHLSEIVEKENLKNKNLSEKAINYISNSLK